MRFVPYVVLLWGALVSIPVYAQVLRLMAPVLDVRIGNGFSVEDPSNREFLAAWPTICDNLGSAMKIDEGLWGLGVFTDFTCSKDDKAGKADLTHWTLEVSKVNQKIIFTIVHPFQSISPQVDVKKRQAARVPLQTVIPFDTQTGLLLLREEVYQSVVLAILDTLPMFSKVTKNNLAQLQNGWKKDNGEDEPNELDKLRPNTFFFFELFFDKERDAWQAKPIASGELASHVAAGTAWATGTQGVGVLAKKSLIMQGNIVEKENREFREEVKRRKGRITQLQKKGLFDSSGVDLYVGYLSFSKPPSTPLTLSAGLRATVGFGEFSIFRLLADRHLFAFTDSVPEEDGRLLVRTWNRDRVRLGLGVGTSLPWFAFEFVPLLGLTFSNTRGSAEGFFGDGSSATLLMTPAVGFECGMAFRWSYFRIRLESRGEISLFVEEKQELLGGGMRMHFYLTKNIEQETKILHGFGLFVGYERQSFAYKSPAAALSPAVNHKIGAAIFELGYRATLL